jgi:hypothetical protein
LISWRILVVGAVAAPLFAQYGGPAILSRGDAPTALTSLQIAFRPFVEVTGVYDSGLAGVSVSSSGQLGNASSEGVSIAAGISGSHQWKHTQLGLDVRGDVNEFTGATYFDSTDESLLLGIKHQFSRHIFLNLREAAGQFSVNNINSSLPQTVPFDPSQSYIPTTDFFDNRTIYVTSQADLIYQRSTRLSFDFGADGFLNRRRSSALYGVTGASARGDVQYRISRRSTLGASYNYNHYSFTRIFSSTDMHGASVVFSSQLSKSMEFSAYGGFQRLENKFVQDVPVDPVITALFGITSGTEVIYGISYIPSYGGRLSKSLRYGVAYVSGGTSVTPGNGLFLTSRVAVLNGGYSYTGLKRWSFSANAGWNKSQSVGNVTGTYGGTIATVSMSRQIVRGLHFVTNVGVRKYSSTTFNNYNRNIYDARIGLGWTPGDIPLRVW